MDYKIGIVKSFDGTSGYIECDNNEYFFTNEDLDSDVDINNKVIFRAETKFNINRSFFVNRNIDNILKGYVNEKFNN